MTKNGRTIGFIGAGNMAEAILGAAIKSGTSDSSSIYACDINAERLEYMKNNYSINTTDNIKELYSACDVIILAVKPQTTEKVLSQLSFNDDEAAGERKIFISIVAGIPLRKMEESLYKNLSAEKKDLLPLIRVMPNTPSLVLEGMSGLCSNDVATDADIETAVSILESMGKVIRFSEEEMDAVTAVSGSGPAYFFYFIESMVKAGTELGLSDDNALTLAVTTMKGAAKLLEESEDSPEILRRKVTSPGGTTEAALNEMKEKGVMPGIISAVKRAAARSKELVECS